MLWHHDFLDQQLDHVGEGLAEARQDAVDTFTINDSSVDKSDIGFSLALGYKFTPNFAVEAAYLQLGKARYEADVTPLQPWLHKAPLVAVNFTTTGDGRGFTQARLLRGRFGYQGELRAVGKIRVDQMFFLARCGFDAFELLDEEDPQVAIAQLDRFSVAYQPGSGELTHPRRRAR
jgi:uncharacterized protein (DUF934 family)